MHQIHAFWKMQREESVEENPPQRQDIGDKLQLKFKHVRDAFKPLNLQRRVHRVHRDFGAKRGDNKH